MVSSAPLSIDIPKIEELRFFPLQSAKSVPPLKPEHRNLFGKALQTPLTERDEARRVFLAQFAHQARDDDAVGLGFAA